MDDAFHYDPARYHERVVHIAEGVVANDDALPTVARRVEVELNSYHGPAIARAEKERMNRLYPKLHL